MNFKLNLALAALLVAIVPAQSQPADTTKTPGTAQVRFIHAVVGEMPVDVFLRGKAAWEGAAFATLSEHLTIPSGKLSLKVARPTETNPFALGVSILAKGGVYTAVAFGEKGKVDVIFQNDLAGLADPRRARIRVFNIAPGLATIALTTPSTRAQDGATTLLNELDYGKDSTRLIEPGKFTLQLRSAGKLLKEKPEVTLEAGQRYMIFILGQGETLDVLVKTMGK